jgi:hypothetical protein
MDKALQEEFKKGRRQFSKSFVDDTMEGIRNLKKEVEVFPLHRYLGAASAACLVAMLLVSYVTHGQLDMDGILGLGDLDISDVSNPFLNEAINTSGE